MDAALITIVALIFIALGLSLGSFSNVLVYRLGNHISLFEKSRSFCPNCKAQIKWYDNIPIISYIVLKGKCRNCHQHISIRYPLIESAGLLIFLACFFMNFSYPEFKFNFDYHSIIFAFIMLILFNMALIDYKTMEIPYELSVPFMIICLGTFIADAVIANDWSITMHYVIGFVAPLVLFGLTYLIPYLIKKIEVIGLGDVILFVFLGLLLNWIYLLFIIMIASIVGSIVELIKIHKTGEKGAFPFGPYIALGAIIVMLFVTFTNDSLIGFINGL